MKKILIFSMIVILSIIYILCQEKFNIGDNVYVVSQSETKNKETVNEVQVEKEKEKDEEKESEIINRGSNQTDRNTITIHISGEVVKPGVVTIEKDSRLSDAVDMLGGVTNEADLNKINLAIKLNDEEHYIIPKIGEDIEIQNINPNNNKEVENAQNNIGSGVKNGKININNATIQDLDTLPEVGEATANKILKHREDNGEFKAVEEIKNVNGIGEKKYESIKDFICVD